MYLLEDLPFLPTKATLAPLGKTYETSCNCHVSPPLCVQLRLSRLMAGGEAQSGRRLVLLGVDIAVGEKATTDDDTA